MPTVYGESQTVSRSVPAVELVPWEGEGQGSESSRQGPSGEEWRMIHPSLVSAPRLVDGGADWDKNMNSCGGSLRLAAVVVGHQVEISK